MVGVTNPEAGYLLARSADDYLACVRALSGMTLWLPVRGQRRQLVVREQGDRRLVRAYTSPERVPGDDPTVTRGFADLLRGWRDHEIGLVVNPDTDSELQLPGSVFGEIVALLDASAPDGGIPAPEARRTVPAIDPPSTVGTVRFAAVYDGVDDTGRPVLSPARPRITDPAERAKLLAYLRGGTVLQAAAGLVDDVFDATVARAVPANTRTDGTWVWQDGLAYYLETYGIAPEPEFLRHIAGLGYEHPTPPPARLVLVRAALQEHQRISADLYQRWRTAHDA